MNISFYNSAKLATIGKIASADIVLSASAKKMTDSIFFDNMISNEIVSLPIIKGNDISLIRDYAFYECSNLTTVSFPACTTIGGSAFYSCPSLTTVSFPACTTIGSAAFRYCYNLTAVSFPVCTTIKSAAFYSCSRLATVSLPSCTAIGSGAFRSCRNLISLYLLSTSVCTLGNSSVFYSTPIGGYNASAGRYGSVFVPCSLYADYISASYWSLISSRIVAYNCHDYNITMSGNLSGITTEYLKTEDGFKVTATPSSKDLIIKSTTLSGSGSKTESIDSNGVMTVIISGISADCILTFNGTSAEGIDCDTAPNGVYILRDNRLLYSSGDWNPAINSQAVGVAVLNDNTKFVIDKNATNSGNTIAWGEYIDVTELSNIESTDNAKLDYDGSGNTDNLIAFQGASASYAAQACRSATIGGKQGYLGSLGQWWIACSNKTEVDACMSTIGGVSLDPYAYWSSTEYDFEYAWNLYWNFGDTPGNFKNDKHMVRAFAALPSASDQSISWEVQSGSWNSSSNSSAHDGQQWVSASPGDNGSTVIRCTFQGVTSITFNCLYQGENNYDYLTIGNLDAACTRTSYGTSLKGTSGTAKDITFTCDAGEHYVEFCYSKDGSASTSPDCATVYIASVL